MKRILSLIALLIISYTSLAQVKYQIGTTTRDVETMRDHYVKGSTYLGLKDTNFIPVRKGAMVTRPADGLLYYWSGLRWYNVMAAGLGNPVGINNTTTRLVSGDATWRGSGLIFDVTACEYYILGKHIFSAATQKTLTAADPTLNRIDVIYLDTSGAVGVLTGVAGASPIKPIVNPQSQLELTNIDIAAASPIPSTISNEVVYDENVEWISSGSGSVNFTYPSTPQNGSYSARIQSTLNPFTEEYMKFTCDSLIPAGNYRYLRFYVRLKTIFTSDASSFNVYFMAAGSPSAQGIVVKHGSYGFDRMLLNTWQLITIPWTSITFNTGLFDEIKIVPPNEVGDFHIDNLVLQTGTPPIGTGYVTSFNSRTGSVLSTKTDYSAWFIERDSLLADLPFTSTNNGTNVTLSIPEADASNDGYLTADDWTYFNGKDTGKWTISGAGIRSYNDKTVGIGIAADSFSLATVGSIQVNNGTFYASSKVWPVIKVQGKEQSIFIGQRSGNFTHTINTNGCNTAVGEYSMQRHTTGVNNTAIGKTAGYNIFTGSYNVLMGVNRMGGDGAGNVEIGASTGGGLSTTGSYNVTLGTNLNPLYPALDSQLTIGNNQRWITGYRGNLTIGDDTTQSYKLKVKGALYVTDSTRFDKDMFVNGLTVGRGLLGNSFNTAMGRDALTSSSTSSVAIGYFAGKILTGINNVAIGMAAMADATGPAGATAIGWNAMRYRTAGNYNTAVGYEAMGLGIGTGSNNNAFGRAALKSLTSGTDNTAIGHLAGISLIDGSGNIFIGSGVGGSATNINNELNIGNWIKGTNGLIGIGLLPTTDRLEVAGNLALTTAGNKIKIATGANASIGTATLASGTVTVSTTAVLTGSKIFVSLNTPSGTLALSYAVPDASIVNATSFVINAVDAAGAVLTTDNSTINWWIIN